MNTVSSSVSYSTSASSSRGISGLASGIDTESLVEAMLSGTQTKIDKQNQQKQTLEWKQEIYRTVISDINAFQLKYLDYTSDTNLRSAGFYSTMSASSSSGLLGVAAGDSAVLGSRTVEILSLASTSSIKSAGAVSGIISGRVDESAVASGSFSLDITLDGVKKTVTVTAEQIALAQGDNLTERAQNALQESLTGTFGADAIRVEADGDGFRLSVAPGRQAVVSGGKESLDAFGLDAGASNRLALNTRLSELNLADILTPGSYTQGEEAVSGYVFSLGGVEFKFSEDTSLSSVLSKINASSAGVKISYSALEDKFSLVSAEPGAGVNIAVAQEQGNLLSVLFGAADPETLQVDGKNAVVKIDHITTERSSNNFTIDGLNFQLKGLTEGEKITVETSRDTSGILDTIKSFISDYNALIEKLNGYTDEDATCKQYPPLTQAQKKEMTEKEIELWEEKAKGGLLHNDSTISAFLSTMRSVFYSKPEGAAFALYDMGIGTSATWEEKGKLVIEDESVLKEKIENHLSDIRTLFNSPKDGILTRLSEAIDDTAKITSGDGAGALVKLAGVKGRYSATQNTISKDSKDIENKISSLKVQYEQQKARYWKQFNAMETLISNMNTQSSWLTQMMGG